MKYILMAALFVFGVPAHAQLSGCQYTSGPLQLQKVRSIASGTQIFGCINESFNILSSSVPHSSTSSVSVLRELAVGKITGNSTSNGVRISSSVTLSDSSTMTVQGNAFSVGGTTFSIVAGTTTIANGQVIITTSNVRIKGNIDGVAAPTGYVGQLIEASGSGQTPGLSQVWVAIATITLTAGDWDVMALCAFTSGGTTVGTEVACAISSSNTNVDTSGFGARTMVTPSVGANQNNWIPTGRRSVRITSSTTYYLIGTFTYSTLGGATFDANSYISARRVF